MSYEILNSDWISDVCSSNLPLGGDNARYCPHIAAVRADPDDRGAAVDSRRKGRRAFIGFGDDNALIDPIIGHEHAESRARSVREKGVLLGDRGDVGDRKSTRLNSSH